MKAMFCPCCNAPLEENGLEPLETTEEHVCDPNGEVSMKMSYRCSDESCLTRKASIIWNSMGERYGGHDFKKTNFIGSNDGPFGSISRKLNVEIYKCGLRKKQHLFRIANIRFEREFDYRADENGKVLHKSWHINKWKCRDKNDDGGYKYEFPIVEFLSFVKEGIQLGLKLSKENRTPKNGFHKFRFSVSQYEKRWPYIWSVKVNRFLFPNLVAELPYYQKF